MLDRNEAHADQNLGQNQPSRDAAPASERPMADREVPLPGTAEAGGPALVVQQWLDGETTEADARRADAKQVDLWKMISTETDQRRRMTTPSYLAANIMAAIPEARVEATTVTAASTTAAMTPKAALSITTVVMLCAGTLALGVVIGMML